MDADGVRDRHRRAVEGFGRQVHAIRDDQWGARTPCSDWDVRQLVNHLVYEQRWAVPLLEGATVADVGDQFEGDLLSDDPVGTWEAAVAVALAAADADGALERDVHLSYGDVPGSDYVVELSVDAVVHTWDLARAIGGDEHLDPELVAMAQRYVEPRLDMLAASGMFDPPVDVPDDADDQTKLLGLFGRRA